MEESPGIQKYQELAFLIIKFRSMVNQITKRGQTRKYFLELKRTCSVGFDHRVVGKAFEERVKESCREDG